MKVLVLCTGNSCRSIMAEALFNYLGQGRFQAWSAGSHPVGYVHPASITTLQRHGISPGQPRSKSWDEMASSPFDLVITVCDQAAAETCPSFAGHTRTLHWSIPDPGRVTGTEDEVNAAFDQTFFLLKERIHGLVEQVEVSRSGSDC
jgi:arsenate reductase (thioredoxin)